MKRHLVFAFLLLVLPFGCAHAEFTNIDEALKSAQAKQQPVFIDFSAIWCHSCHAMDDQVLNGADWDQRQTRMVLVRSDADSENGDAWMKKLKIPTLPTYIVLNPDGSERGRLVGEIERAKFYPSLDRLLDGSDGVEQLKAQAAKGSVEAVVKVLNAYSERKDTPVGIQWYKGLPETTRKAVESNANAMTRLHIAEMKADSASIVELIQQADGRGKSGKKDEKDKKAILAGVAPLGQSCRTHAQQALAGTLTVDERVDVMGTMISWCSQDLSPAQRKTQAQTLLPPVRTLYDANVPNGGSGRLRDATHLLAGLYKVSGDQAAAKAVYARAVDIGRKALDDGHGGLDVKRDRGMDMVLAEMMYYAERKDELVALHKALVEAYPDDYYWVNERGNDLLDAGKAAEALPYFERALKGAVGMQKVYIAHSCAKALIALNRRAEGEKIYNDALSEANKSFPEQVARVKSYMKL